MEKYGAALIVISAYDPTWPILFEEESVKIKKALGSFALGHRACGQHGGPWSPIEPYHRPVSWSP